MAPSAASFIAAVKKQLDVRTDGELVKLLGWEPHETSNISKWRTGKNAPSYEPVMDMLEATGWLSVEARTALRRAEEEAQAAEEEGRRLAERGRHGHLPANEGDDLLRSSDSSISRSSSVTAAILPPAADPMTLPTAGSTLTVHRDPINASNG